MVELVERPQTYKTGGFCPSPVKGIPNSDMSEVRVHNLAFLCTIGIYRGYMNVMDILLARL